MGSGRGAVRSSIESRRAFPRIEETHKNAAALKAHLDHARKARVARESPTPRPAAPDVQQIKREVAKLQSARKVMERDVRRTSNSLVRLREKLARVDLEIADGAGIQESARPAERNAAKLQSDFAALKREGIRFEIDFVTESQTEIMRVHDECVRSILRKEAQIALRGDPGPQRTETLRRGVAACRDELSELDRRLAANRAARDADLQVRFEPVTRAFKRMADLETAISTRKGILAEDGHSKLTTRQVEEEAARKKDEGLAATEDFRQKQAIAARQASKEAIAHAEGTRELLSEISTLEAAISEPVDS